MADSRKISTPAEAVLELDRDRTLILDKDTIVEWMGASDLERLGAVDAPIDGRVGRDAIRPPLDVATIDAFRRDYYSRCFRENLSGEWTDSRYEAGWAIASWITHLSDLPSVDAQLMEAWKRTLADLYREGDEELRTCVVNAILEHLFERAEIRRLFDDWRLDPLLSTPFRQASEWSEGPART